jgi:hypothetical protein
MSATVEISEEDGEYTAIDSEKGAVGIGNTRAMALAALAVRLGAEETMDTEDQTELRALADRTRERFEKQGVTEDAIAARSE